MLAGFAALHSGFVPMRTSLLPVQLAAPVVRMVAEPMNSYAGPQEGDAYACYLFQSEGGLKYVCTSKPEELAFMMGVNTEDLVTGVKPDDLDIIECAEDWSHNGTPQWVCKAELPKGEAWKDKKA